MGSTVWIGISLVDESQCRSGFRPGAEPTGGDRQQRDHLKLHVSQYLVPRRNAKSQLENHLARSGRPFFFVQNTWCGNSVHLRSGGESRVIPDVLLTHIPLPALLD